MANPFKNIVIERCDSPTSWGFAAAKAVLEISFLFVIASLVSDYIESALLPDNVAPGIRQYAASPESYIPVTNYLLAAVTALGLFSYYGVLFPLIYFWERVRAKASIRDFGLTLGEQTVLGNCSIGVVLFCFAALPVNIAWALNDYFGFGEGAAHYAVLKALPRDFGYWLYMAIGSFLLVPIFEEIQFRGYMFPRLSASFGPIAALILTSVAFTVVHRQYLTGDPFGAIMAVCILFQAMCGTYVTYRTGSLVPAIVAHGIGNQPLLLEDWYPNTLVIFLMAAVAWSYRRQVIDYLRAFWRDCKEHMIPRWKLAFGLGLIALIFVLIPLTSDKIVRVGILGASLICVSAVSAWKNKKVAPG